MQHIKPRVGERFRPYKVFHGFVIPNALAQNKVLKPISKLVWGRLAQYLGKEGEAYVRYDTLAEELGTSESSIKRAVAQLRAEGFIETKQRYNTSNLFYFIWHESFNMTYQTGQDDTETDQYDLSPVQNDPETGQSEFQTGHNEPQTGQNDLSDRSDWPSKRITKENHSRDSKEENHSRESTKRITEKTHRRESSEGRSSQRLVQKKRRLSLAELANYVDSPLEPENELKRKLLAKARNED